MSDAKMEAEGRPKPYATLHSGKNKVIVRIPPHIRLFLDDKVVTPILNADEDFGLSRNDVLLGIFMDGLKHRGVDLSGAERDWINHVNSLEPKDKLVDPYYWPGMRKPF